MNEDEPTRDVQRERSRPTDAAEDDEEWRLPDDDRAETEREAERMVEIESLLREQREESEVRTAREPVDGDGDVPRRAEVIGARKVGPDAAPGKVIFTGVDDEGRRLEFDVPWPDDVTDESEPLVRLLSWYGLSVDEFASITGESVPLRLDHDGEVAVHVPPIPALGNRLWFRIKRWGMRNGLVKYAPGSLVRTHRRSPYSATRLWLVLLTLAGVLAGTFGLVVVPQVVPLSGVWAWLAYALFVGIPSATVGGIALLLSPIVALILGAKGYRWIRDRFFPSG